MRRALVVSPIDPDSSAFVSKRVESIAWLRETLGRAGFEVTVVSDAESAKRRIDDAIARVTQDDALLVHVAGDLTDAGSIRLDAEHALSLREVSDAAAARAPAAVAFFAELAHAGSRDDSLAATEHVEIAREAIDARARGAWALVAVHPRSDEADPIAFSRLVLSAAEAATAEGPVFLSDVYERVRVMPDSHAAAQSYALVRGADEFELACVVPPDAGSVTALASTSELVDLGDDDEDDDDREGDGADDHAPDDRDDYAAPDTRALVALADHAYARDAIDQAIAGYRATLALLAPGDLATRASVLARLGQIARGRGHVEEATRAFERALAMVPTERAALDGLVDLANVAGDWDRAVALRRRRLDAIDDVVERVDELFALARTLVEKKRDVPGAIEELTRARALDPQRHDVLEALRRANRVVQRWAEVLEVTDALVGIASAASERAKLRLSQARIAIERLEDDDRGAAYLEAALADAPDLEEARVLLAAIRGESSTAEPEYSRLSSSGVVPREPNRGRLARRARRRPRRARRGARGDHRARDTLRAGALGRHGVRAPPRAAHARRPRRARVPRGARPRGARRGRGRGASDAQSLPPRPRPSRARVARRSGVALAPRAGRRRRGRSNLHRGEPRRRRGEPRGAPRATPARDAQSRAPPERPEHGVDRPLLPLGGAGARRPEPGALRARQGPRRHRRGPHVAALDRDRPGRPERPVDEEDLAFLTGRHVTYYRNEHQVVVHYPTLGELTVLLLAAVQLVSPGLPVQQGYAEDVAALRERLQRQITEADRVATATAVRKLEARGHRVNLAAWIRGVELTACRAGLFLAGDLRSAMNRVRAETRGVAGVTADDRRADLLSFCASSVHAELRDRFAVTTASAAPNRATHGAMLATG